MEQKSPLPLEEDLMRQFADLTGLTSGNAPQRYLWTDAFAVCNFLELFRRTQKEDYRELALRLVEQVHHTLGRHREDDERTGWISGLGEEEGERHPTAGGLRIGKKLNERPPGAPPDAQLEWDRDGQYYHYLTKWMHALHRVSRVTGETVYNRWAIEMAKAVHSRFTYLPPSGGRKRMHWKMSIDLSWPLVPSMGQHDPLDGLVTFSELLVSAPSEPATSSAPDLGAEIADLAEICREMSWDTDDPLGIGGLLFDACRIVRLTVEWPFEESAVLAAVLDSAMRGLAAFAVRSPFGLPAGYRLGFRELGLSIGLAALDQMQQRLEEDPGRFEDSLHERMKSLFRYRRFREEIETFWSTAENRESAGWLEHGAISSVMLATSLAPEGFLMV